MLVHKIVKLILPPFKSTKFNNIYYDGITFTNGVPFRSSNSHIIQFVLSVHKSIWTRWHSIQPSLQNPLSSQPQLENLFPVQFVAYLRSLDWLNKPLGHHYWFRMHCGGDWRGEHPLSWVNLQGRDIPQVKIRWPLWGNSLINDHTHTGYLLHCFTWNLKSYTLPYDWLMLMIT